MHRLAAILLSVYLSIGAAFAQSGQEIVWVQIEAQPSLNAATRAAQGYAAELQDVNGFAVGGGWYAIVLGPYARDDAELVLRSYRRDRLIARDSFITFTAKLRQQFWPVGANILGRDAVDAPLTAQTDPTQQDSQIQTPAPAPQPEPTPEPEPQEDETPREAQRSEAQLTRDERKALQVALEWAGFYNSAIDGAFGRGTRNSMANWQTANGFKQTGILTTLQRKTLLDQYNAVLDGLGLATVRDAKAGIEMLMPSARVAFDSYEPPFVHYSGDGPAKVLLISQAGDQNTLYGLYDIMQTLEIVPLEGPRSRKNNSFTLVGQNASIISHTEATLKNGQVKGFTLIWPTGDEEARTRLLKEMQDSFETFDAVLDPATGGGEDQAIDLIAGLQIRKPIRSRSGFFVDARGTVASSADAVGNCTRITLDGDTEADVVGTDAALGVAFLRPKEALSPRGVAQMSPRAPRLQSEIAVAGYPYEGVLGAPSMTFGTLSDLQGLKGEAHLNRLALSAQDGDAGGPVLDASGNVMGMLLPKTLQGGTQLPAEVSFALSRAALAQAASQAGVALKSGRDAASLPPQDLTAAARAMTVLVSCWE